MNRTFLTAVAVAIAATGCNSSEPEATTKPKKRQKPLKLLSKM